MISDAMLPKESDRGSQRNSSLPPSKTQEVSKTKMRSSSPGYNKIKENNNVATNPAYNMAIKPSWVF